MSNTKNHNTSNSTEFVSFAAHQLLTPLSAIGWYSEMLLSGKNIKTKKQEKEFLREIYNSNRRMVRLVISLLNISRIELGKLGVNPEKTDLIQIAAAVLQEIKKTAKEKLPAIKIDYNKKTLILHADPKFIEVILQTLLINAIRYTPQTGKIVLTVSEKNKKILITVADNGIGIPKNQQAKIFEKFFRADNARLKYAYGVGLGLYLIKLVLEIVGGQIWFKSSENKGSTFFVELPMSGMKKRVGEKGLVSNL